MLPESKRPRVSIGVAAFNAEDNIGELLRALCSQREDAVEIEEIIVHSDQSTDRTLGVVAENPDPRVIVIDNPSRKGFAAAARSMVQSFKGEALLLLNDDIRICDDRFVEKMAAPIFSDCADLVSANPQPLPPRTFVERAFVLTLRVYERIRESMRDSSSILTCDGAALCWSRRLARAIKFPDDDSSMGNVDAFLYLFCVLNGYRYTHVCDARVRFRAPSTLRDYLRRNIRNDSQERLLTAQFGPAVRKVFRRPAALYWKFAVIEGLRHPLHAAFVVSAGFYIRFKVRSGALRMSPTWETLVSSKRLN